VPANRRRGRRACIRMENHVFPRGYWRSKGGPREYDPCLLCGAPNPLQAEWARRRGGKGR